MQNTCKQLIVSTYLPELEHVECKRAEATVTNIIMTDRTSIPVLVEDVYLALIDFECQCHNLLGANMSHISVMMVQKLSAKWMC